MANLNRWEGIGRLGNDIELRYMPNGDAVANFNIAVDDSYKDKQGHKVEKTEWVRCVAFGTTAEFLGQWLHKGKRLLAVGKLKTREFEKDGVKRYVTEIHLSQGTEIIDWPEKDQQPPQRQQQSAPRQQQSQRPPQNQQPDYDDFSDDIPF
mgnify:CR=1 FL=1